MTDLTAFDYVFFFLLGLFALLGLKRGFVTEILGLLAWVGGIIAVNLYFDQALAIISGFIDNATAASVVTVLVLFFVTFGLLKAVAAALGSRVKNSVIGPLDRLLGLGFGAVKGLLLAVLSWMLLTLIFDVVPADRPVWLADARSGPVLALFAEEVEEFVERRRAISAEAEGYEENERDALDALLDQAESVEL
ncbi:MAG: CvpA family protein [Pacificimonas sp.]|jgi:membrane protein required for colicin V production|nr:CvpA family protein [Pacificimonas sp.]